MIYYSFKVFRGKRVLACFFFKAMNVMVMISLHCSRPRHLSKPRVARTEGLERLRRRQGHDLVLHNSAHHILSLIQ